MRVIIVHGYDAAPNEHWFPWLRDELTAQGIECFVVELPHPSHPDSAEWLECLTQTIGVPGNDTVIVAHSLGCIAVTHFLSTLPRGWELGGFIAVSGFEKKIPGLPELDMFIAESNSNLFLTGGTIGRIVVVHSDNDPIVPPALSEDFADALGAETLVIPGGGHFLDREGFSRLPEVRDEVVRNFAG